MKNALTYKNYHGSVEFSAEDQVFYGKILGIRDVVTFEGTSVDEINAAFKESVDDYIKTCKQYAKEPDKAFKGSFNVRVKPNIHRMISVKAQALRICMVFCDVVTAAVCRNVEPSRPLERIWRTIASHGAPFVNCPIPKL